MTVKRLYKTVLCTTTTATGDVGIIRGKILKIQVLNDTGSCGWWIFTDGSDNATGSGDVVDENILGATGAGHIDTVGATFYPATLLKDNTDATLSTDAFRPLLVDGKLEYDIDDCADGEVLSIVIWYEPYSD